MIYLRTFNERMRLRRRTNLGKYLERDLGERLIELKRMLMKYSAPLVNVFMESPRESYLIDPKDDFSISGEKVKTVKKLVAVQLNNLEKCAADLVASPALSELLYYLCKHGSYGCLHSMHTPEEINIMCIS
jgi:hypothetical protein